MEKFLDMAIVAFGSHEAAPFFFWVDGFPHPGGIFLPQEEADEYGEPVDQVVMLYVRHGGQFGGGLFYHQGYHRAAVFMGRDAWDWAFPIKEFPSLWHPLETVLSNWIELVHLGKITASPRDAPALFGSEKFGPWEWRPYSEA